MKPDLLVLAAGMGSRYGGLKQMDPIGPNGEFILDYSVGDALAAGFGRVIFVIRPDIEADFRRIVGERWEKRMDVAYAMQVLTDLPAPYTVPADRTKPWGTAHDVLAARKLLDRPFAVVNADDCYGADAFARAASFLADPAVTDPAAFAMVAYRLANTLSETASVSRGVCAVDAQGMLTSIEERLALKREADGVVRDAGVAFPDDTPVSMNLFAFRPRYVEMLEEGFPKFLAAKINVPKSEYQMPTELGAYLREGRATVRVLRTTSRWYGVTSRDDRPAVAAYFKTLPSPFAKQ